MARKNINNVIDEYAFLQKKVKKLTIQASTESAMSYSRLVKKVKQILKRMVAIEDECKRMGWGHPEAHLQGQKQVNAEDMYKIPGDTSKLMFAPDGRLPASKPITIEDLQAMENSMSPMGTPVNPDGTLFETPKLEGSFLPRKKEMEEPE